MDELQTIKLENIYTEGNENWGLLLNLVNLRKDNAIGKRISITVNNFEDNGSKYGISFWLNRKNNYKNNIGGSVVIDNIMLENNLLPIKYYSTYDNDIEFSINNLVVNQANISKLEDIISQYKWDKNIRFIRWKGK